MAVSCPGTHRVMTVRHRGGNGSSAPRSEARADPMAGPGDGNAAPAMREMAQPRGRTRRRPKKGRTGGLDPIRPPARCRSQSPARRRPGSPAGPATRPRPWLDGAPLECARCHRVAERESPAHRNCKGVGDALSRLGIRRRRGPTDVARRAGLAWVWNATRVHPIVVRRRLIAPSSIPIS